jgi:hypothetical protein
MTAMKWTTAFTHSSVLAVLALSVGACSGPVDAPAAAAAAEPSSSAESVAAATQADSTCVNLLANVRNSIPHVGPAYGWVNVAMSLHREDPNWGVQYMYGYFVGSGTSTTLSGSGGELFSIRSTSNGQQPFSAVPKDVESLTWSIDANGVMSIYNNTWHFSMGQINFSCIGNMMTVHQPGWGVFTLTFTGYGGPATL